MQKTPVKSQYLRNFGEIVQIQFLSLISTRKKQVARLAFFNEARQSAWKMKQDYLLWSVPSAHGEKNARFASHERNCIAIRECFMATKLPLHICGANASFQMQVLFSYVRKQPITSMLHIDLRLVTMSQLPLCARPSRIVATACSIHSQTISPCFVGHRLWKQFTTVFPALTLFGEP